MTGRAPEVDVIRLWIEEGRTREVDSLRPEEIGAAAHRTRLLYGAIIDGIVHIERHVAPRLHGPLGRHLVEVYAIDAAYADNEEGLSDVSAPRVGALLGLSDRTIQGLRRLLVELRLQGHRRGGQAGDRRWPIIPRSLAGSRISRVWWLDATSELSGGLWITRPTLRVNPEAHGLPDFGTAISGSDGAISGSQAYATRGDFSGLAGQSRESESEREATASLSL